MGHQIHQTCSRYLHSQKQASAIGLGAVQRTALLTQVSAVFAPHVVSQSKLKATQKKAIRILGVHEAWIYRDWQDAIGDWMLVETSSSARRFDVVGYRAFVADERSPADAHWADRLSALTTGLNVKADRATDARIAQLESVYHAVSTLLVEFAAAEPAHSGIDPVTLTAAAKVQTAGTPVSPTAV